MAEYAHPEVLVDAAWLAAHLNDPTVRVIEVGEDPLAYAGGHIPGAVYWDVYATILKPADLRTEDDPAVVAAMLGAAGITPATTVVLVSLSPVMGAWVFWFLRLYGHQNAVVLNGGRAAWQASGGPLTRDEPTHAATEYPTPTIDPSVRADLAAARAAQDQVGAVMVDARAPQEYRGEWFVSGPPGEGERGGHMPGAVYLHFREALNDDGTFRPADELHALFAEHGITPDLRVITYCMIGMRAGHMWFVLRYLLDYPQVLSYDGSWNEWGRQADTPVEQ